MATARDGRPSLNGFPAATRAHLRSVGPSPVRPGVRPWSGTWDDLPAAHGAAVTLTLLGLWLLGHARPAPGWVLAYAWAAFPFTLYTANSNSNDGLVAMLLTLVCSSSVGHLRVARRWRSPV